jgi:transcriptional regulator EpsA
MRDVNIHNDGIGILQTAEASLRIRDYGDLVQWLQGDVQNFLPHEVLIAAWGDFSASNITYNILSASAHLRREGKYGFGNPSLTGISVCLETNKPIGTRRCGAFSFLLDMRDRWLGHRCRPYVALKASIEDDFAFICQRCNQDAAKLLSSMRSSLVHGFSDQRGKLECIYVFLSSEDLSDTVYRRSLRFFLPYLDHSLRQVSHLPVQVDDSSSTTTTPKDEAADLSGLSQREVEIMEWVRIGKTNFEVAMILNISAFTVKNHLQRIFRKLDASNRAQAVEKLNRFKQDA